MNGNIKNYRNTEPNFTSIFLLILQSHFTISHLIFPSLEYMYRLANLIDKEHNVLLKLILHDVLNTMLFKELRDIEKLH
jgi:hypothetical protein